MSISDFCSMSPQEFREAHRCWLEHEEAEMQGGWEMTRMLALFLLQPYSKKKLRPSDVMKFPWDGRVGEEKRKSPPARSTEGRFLEVKGKLEKKAG